MAVQCGLTYTDIKDISYGCNVAFGGVKGVKLKPLSDGGNTNLVEFEFNPHDAVTNGSEQKTTNPDGTVQCTQTLVIELPKLSDDKMAAIKAISNPNMEFKVFVLTKSGVMLTLGNKFGATVSTIDITSGTGRRDKNRIQVTFSADEDELAPVADNGSSEWSSLTPKSDGEELSLLKQK